MSAAQRIAVIGNAGAGKTALSRELARSYSLPIVHVDSIQFLAGMTIRPHAESIRILTNIQNQKTWIIDGYGPLDILEKRLELADKIVFIDFPLWRHYWWCLKRQIKCIWHPRQELPEGCDEATWQQTKKLFKTLWRVHRQMRPELLRILNREIHHRKVVYVRTLAEWHALARKGFS